jgi:hypothetical protein
VRFLPGDVYPNNLRAGEHVPPVVQDAQHLNFYRKVDTRTVIVVNVNSRG